MRPPDFPAVTVPGSPAARFAAVIGECMAGIAALERDGLRLDAADRPEAAAAVRGLISRYHQVVQLALAEAAALPPEDQA